MAINFQRNRWSGGTHAGDARQENDLHGKVLRCHSKVRELAEYTAAIIPTRLCTGFNLCSLPGGK